MSPTFVDTGYLVALETSDDQHHAAALHHWRVFSAALPRLVTTSYLEALAFDAHFEQAGFRKLR